MSSQFQAFVRRSHLTSAGLLPVCLALSACGGGGGGVASIPPPPPTPTPGPTATSVEVATTWLTSPATQIGTYDILGLVSQTSGGSTTTRAAGPGEFQLAVATSGPAFKYTLDTPSGFLPGGLLSTTLPVPTDSWDFNVGGPNYRYDNPYGDVQQYFGQNLKEYEVQSNGSKTLREDYDYDHAAHNGVYDLPTGQRVSESLVFDAGLSYVAMGEWSWGPVTVGTSTPTGDSSAVYFVYGNRTPGSGIPTSGTATYDARTLGAASTGSIPFSLTADFGQRAISTQISQASLFDVSGRAPFSNAGSFNIPLSGTAGAQTATGAMSGAFFGPQAEQVGGTFAIGPVGGSVLIQDAFVGEQHPH